MCTVRLCALIVIVYKLLIENTRADFKLLMVMVFWFSAFVRLSLCVCVCLCFLGHDFAAFAALSSVCVCMHVYVRKLCCFKSVTKLLENLINFLYALCIDRVNNNAACANFGARAEHIPSTIN